MEAFEEFAAKFEKLGESEVRENFVNGVWIDRNKAYVSE